MKSILILTAFLALFSGCCRKPIQTYQKDSTTTVVRTEYIEKLRDTTIYVELPQESHEAYSYDSVYRETSIAFAWAKTDTLGLILLHLENKKLSLSKDVQIKDTQSVRDSLVYRDVYRENTVTVNVLKWWQKALICWGVICAIFMVGKLLIKKYL